MARFFTKDYALAVSDYEAAVQRSPTALFIRWLLAAAYVRAGRMDDAEWQVEELKSLGFNGDDFDHSRNAAGATSPILRDL